METPGPSPEVTLDDALGVFTNLDRPSTPLTASEVGEELQCTRRTAHRKLEELSDRGDLETKTAGAHSRVWWQPRGQEGGPDDGTAAGDRDEFGQFVADVEDYAIFTLEPDGTVATWNEGARRIKGYEESEIVGEHFSEFYTEEDAEAGVPEENLANAQENGRIEDEGWRVRADGSEFWADVVISAIRDDGGDLVGFTKVTRDMTDRRKYEQRLQRERKRTEKLLETAPIPIAVQNEDGETIMANERAQEVLGLAESEIVEGLENEDEWALNGADGEPIDGGEMPPARVLATGEPVYDEEIVIEDPDGDRTWFSINAAPFTGPDGEGERVVVAGEDVTDLKERERELETELSEMLGRVSDAFYALDDEWQFTHVNDRAVDVLQRSRDELLGESIWDVFPDVGESSVRNHFREAFDAQESRTFEQYYEGIDRWLEFNVYPSESGLSVYFQDITERKEHEQDLAKYGTIVETMNDGIYVKDEEGRFTMVNDAYAEMTGYDREEMVGAHASLVVDEGTIRESKSVLEGEGDMPVEASIETADGNTIEAEGTFATLASGEEVGVVRDVTERKEREQQLQERERQLSTLMDNVPGMVYRSRNERNWPMEFVSDGCGDLTGYDSAALERGDVSFGDAIVHREDREDLWEEIQRELEDDGAFLVTYRIVTEDGDVRWVRERGRRVGEEDGTGMIEGVIIDVTERKEYERELERKERRYQAVFEDPNILVGLLEPDGTVLDINDTAMEYVDAELEDLVGEQFSKTPWWESDDGIQSDVREWVERAAAGEYVDFEADLTRPSGERYVLSGYFRPVTNDDGEVVSIIVSDRDITEQKEYQRDLERSEQRYRVLVENFPNGAVALVDGDLRYQTVGGDPVDQGSGGPSRLEGKTIREALTPELADTVEPGYRAALEGESNTYEVEQGDQVVEIQTYPVRDEDGEVFAALGMSQDVTERVEHQRYLQDAKSRLEAATEAGAVGTWEWDVHLDEMVANPSMAKTFGLDPEATMDGLPLDRYVEQIHEEDRERVERRIETALENRSEYEMEYRVWNADDELRWVVARGHVETDEDGTPTTFPGAVTDITERKEYQRRIEESERRYRTLVENFPDGAVGLFDDDLTYTAVGGQFLEQADIAREDRIGRSVHEIYPEELAAEVEPYFEAALNGEANSFEIEFHDRYLFAHTLPVTDAGGEVIAGMLVVQDVTERREAQRELRESEAKFRMIAENLEEIVWMTTPDAEEFVYLNPAFEKVWGIDRQQLYDESLSFIDRVHPEDREHVREEFTSLPEEDFDEEFRILRPDGEERWVNARGTWVTDEDSEMTRIVGIGNDVTERVERERELEESERRYRTLAENFPNGAAGVYDRNLRYTLAGGAMLGEGLPTADEFEGDRMPDLFPDDVAEDLEPLFRAAVEDGETGTTTTEFGGSAWQVWAAPLRNADGEIFAGLSLAQDITEQIEREHRLEELVDQLEESNERLEQFAYVASHDLQEPLRMISNYLQLLEQRYGDELDSDAEEFIDFAVDGAERMREMISDLLAYSRLDTETTPFEPTDAEAIVENVFEDLQLRIDETDASITVEPLPTVEADENQLEMVFQNLVSNAIKYSGDEPPVIEIGADRQSEAWRFHVADEGIGIDSEHADDVFDVFNRLHTHEEYPGTGIGLAMCEKIVRHHGGDIWVESEHGSGSTFYFTVPDDSSREETTMLYDDTAGSGNGATDD